MFNVDGFNERTTYIHNSNDRNRLKKSKLVRHDSSFAKMKVNENRPTVRTYHETSSNYLGEARGAQDNFVLRNYNMMHFNQKPVSSDLTFKNRLKKF